MLRLPGIFVIYWALGMFFVIAVRVRDINESNRSGITVVARCGVTILQRILLSSGRVPQLFVRRVITVGQESGYRYCILKEGERVRK